MIKTADVIYYHAEPASFCSAAFKQLQAAGLVVNAIPMPQDDGEVLRLLRASPADAIVFVSPVQFWQFMVAHHDHLTTLGKPLIACATEYTFGNAFPGYRDFEQMQSWADFYVCGQSSDTEAMRQMGRKAETLPLWVATDLFRPGPRLAERIQKFCFIGHTADYHPGIYSERRRLLGALQQRGLIDILSIPRSDQTAHLVAQAYASYAGVFCPPANGKGHSIRVYEALACGTLVAEVQPLDLGGDWFKDRHHRLALPEGISGDDLCTWVEDLRFSDWQDTASRGRDFCRARMNPPEVWRSIFAAADKALG
jgi:hypothetical protein